MTLAATPSHLKSALAPARLILLFVMAALWPATSAFGENYNECVTRQCSMPHASITGCAVWCEYLLKERPNQQAAPAQLYGAFFLESRTLRFGYASGYPSRAAAENEARDGCIEDGGKAGDCKLVAWFYNKCAALALSAERDPKDNKWAWAMDDYKSKASSKALTACRNNGGTQCKVEAAKCSG